QVEDTGHMSFPVVQDGKLRGIITWTDLHNAVRNHDRHLAVGDYYVRDVLTITPDDTLTQALDRLGQKEISHLPVVSPQDNTLLVGLITKGDIIKAYNQRRLARRKLSWDQNGESL
ncbi:MAG: CBS domain-containing protein, partial [Candidatus Thermoplasmatota archaeon]|nr:CBS domain-containing protein [Candidatus Thermoplasmatota archaeon]